MPCCWKSLVQRLALPIACAIPLGVSLASSHSAVLFPLRELVMNDIGEEVFEPSISE